MNAEKLKRLQTAVRTGGKGSVRRKRKVIHKQAAADDKKLQATFKRLGVNPIPGIEEVNMFKDDGNVIHFKNPKLQANFNANTYVVSGKSEIKSVQDVIPSMFTPEMLQNLSSLHGFDKHNTFSLEDFGKLLNLSDNWFDDNMILLDPIKPIDYFNLDFFQNQKFYNTLNYPLTSNFRKNLYIKPKTSHRPGAKVANFVSNAKLVNLKNLIWTSSVKKRSVKEKSSSLLHLKKEFALLPAIDKERALLYLLFLNYRFKLESEAKKYPSLKKFIDLWLIDKEDTFHTLPLKFKNVLQTFLDQPSFLQQAAGVSSLSSKKKICKTTFF